MKYKYFKQIIKMKGYQLLFIVFAILMAHCKKSNNGDPVNCNGLVTDTAGTGDIGRVFMPTAFTPNGDGLNDVIRPLLQNISSIEFTIYDINYNIVFSTNIAGDGWITTSPGNSSTQYYFKVQVTTNANNKIGLCGQVFGLTCLPPGVPQTNYRFEDQFTPNGFTGVTNENLGTCP
jgi:gliding motility-associated-like protein